jgi:hypothetical protein
MNTKGALIQWEVQIPLNGVKSLADALDFLKEILRANLISVGQDGRHLPFVFLKKNIRYLEITFRLLIYVFLEHTSNGN